MFCLWLELRLPSIADSPSVALPVAVPALTDARSEPPTACPPRHLTKVSDVHSVLSHPEGPTRTAVVHDTAPKCDPRIVRLMEPEAGRFHSTRAVATSSAYASSGPRIVGMSTVKLSDKQPITPPTDKTIILDRVPPPPRLLATAVSDDHCVSSHTLIPELAMPVYPRDPIPAPYIVTLADPVVAPLLPSMSLAIPAASDTASLTDPTRSPALTTAARLDPMPAVPRHCIDVSDSHQVASHPVHPIPAAPQTADKAIPAPCTVTTTDPDAAALLARIELIAPAETDRPAVTLPETSPAVADTRRDDLPELLTRQATLLLDTHVDASHPLSPPTTRAVYVLTPTFDPITVMLPDPVLPATFDTRTVLAAMVPTDTPSVTLPMVVPDVTDVRRVPRTICPVLQRTVESDTHSLPSQLLLPDRNVDVGSHTPILAPCTVTLTLPVDPATLLASAPLKPWVPYDVATDMLPTLWPAVISARPLRPLPPPPRTIIDVSDPHKLASHPLGPPSLPTTV